MKIKKIMKRQFFSAVFLASLTYCVFAYADAGVTDEETKSAQDAAEETDEEKADA